MAKLPENCKIKQVLVENEFLPIIDEIYRKRTFSCFRLFLQAHLGVIEIFYNYSNDLAHLWFSHHLMTIKNSILRKSPKTIVINSLTSFQLNFNRSRKRQVIYPGIGF